MRAFTTHDHSHNQVQDTYGHSDAFSVEGRLRDRTEQQQRARYGGFHFGAAFFGWLVANSIAALLIATLAAFGGAVALTTYTTLDNLTNNATVIGSFSAILVVAVLMLAYYAGGYVAGRLARFDGALQGFGTWLIGIAMTILLSAAAATLGSDYNILQQLNLPNLPLGSNEFVGGGLATLIISIPLTLIAAIAGGKMGERYHHKVDEAGSHLPSRA